MLAFLIRAETPVNINTKESKQPPYREFDFESFNTLHRVNIACLFLNILIRLNQFNSVHDALLSIFCDFYNIISIVYTRDENQQKLVLPCDLPANQAADTLKRWDRNSGSILF